MQTQVFNTVQTQVLEAQAQAVQNRVAASAAAKTENESQLRSVAQDFESVFLGQMLQPMFETIPTDGMFSGGNAEKIYRGMMVQEASKEIAKNGGIGIADSVYRELLKLQEQ